MQDLSKKNKELVAEISVLKQRIQNLEQWVLDHKKAEETMRESEAKYRLAFESTSDGIFTIDCNFNISNITPSVERQLGYKVEEVINRPIQDLNILTPESLTRAVSDVIKVFSGVEVAGAVYEFVAKDGTKKIGEVTGTPIIREGKILGVAAIVRDITERKRMEEVLTKSEEKFRKAFYTGPDSVNINCLNDGMYVSINPGFTRIMGYTEEEIIGKTSVEYNIWENIEDRRRLLDGLRRDGEVINLEAVFRTKDGDIRHGLMSASIINLNDVPHILSITRDITDRKQMEEALRESEERYRTILENIEDGYFEVDVSGNFTFFNDSVCRMLGNTRAELMGMNHRQYTDKENSQKLYRAFNNVFRTGEPSPGVDYEIIGKDRTKRYLQSSASLIRNSSGQPIGFRGIMRNITDRKRMEEALRESENRYRELSIVDGLTQLYNSRHFYQQLRTEIDRVDRYGQPLSLLLLDLDDFKAFNDAYGHVEGDQVLSRLGQVVKRCLRQTDSAYRYGGEEFTILLPMTTGSDCVVTAERLRTEFRKEVFSPVPGQEVHMTVSIGLAQYKMKEDMKAFVHRVDQLMYQGKKNGKDRICSGS
jgi:diguanylate cyclase (GGDEF)-like protein/PAS domain S-box-containing protein